MDRTYNAKIATGNKHLSGLTLSDGWEGVCCDATITTSIWLVNRKTFVNDILSSRGTENYYLHNA